ncbi:MAG: type II toxin-antitoxin system prevent-host-death family antitoxin [Actinomycetota bacterium]|nr:type II toxin-antitoxin system prevent-host-death family antitoxin [Actinomycetota bacterium]
MPAQRGTEREIAIRELRNAGKVLAELADTGAVGKVTSGGRLVGWLVPASPEERRMEELIAEGVLIRAERPGGLAGRRPLPPRTDGRSLSETLLQMRDEERC